jgi:hypothetical protein
LTARAVPAAPPSRRPTVLCVKWGTKYDALYVNRLASMVRRRLPVEHRFVCLTEDPTGLDPGVEARPMPRDDLHGSWNKLCVFSPALDDLAGPALYLDLDVVVRRDLLPFFTHRAAEPILGVTDWYRPHTWNSSVLRFEVGAWSRIFEEFLARRDAGDLRPSADPAEVGIATRTQVYYDHRQDPPRRFPGDQEWTTSLARPDGAHVRSTFPRRWIASWKKHCRERRGAPFLSRIVVFHGTPKPHEVDRAWVRRHWA